MVEMQNSDKVYFMEQGVYPRRKELFARSQKALVIDLEDISYVSSECLRFFYDLFRRNPGIRIRNLHPRVKKVFMIAGLRWDQSH